MPVTTSSEKWRRAKAAHLRLGCRGEAIACRLLKGMGMTVLVKGFVGPHGEIDLVARDGAVLCFVEVKTRRHPSRYSRPADAVTPKKMWNLIRTAERYLRQLGHPRLVYRFDIVEVLLDGRRIVEARLWADAFSRRSLSFTDDGTPVKART